eukprot:11636826-Karenia_brevis.AAC.1
MPDAELDRIFEERVDYEWNHHNFTTYVAGNPLERKERRVIVKAKYKPLDTYCQHLRYMDHKFKKTTMA